MMKTAIPAYSFNICLLLITITIKLDAYRIAQVLILINYNSTYYASDTLEPDHTAFYAVRSLYAMCTTPDDNTMTDE